MLYPYEGKILTGPWTHTIKKKKKNFRWTKVLNAKDKTIKLLKDNLGDYLYELECSWKGFLKPDTVMQILKGKIEELNYVKINNFCSSKGTTKTVKW